jgi:hypothetical protein
MDYGKYFNRTSATDEVAEMIARAGNRSERRKILKALNKTQNIVTMANERITKDANKELERRANDSFGYIMGTIGIVLHDMGYDDEAVEKIFTEMNDDEAVEKIFTEMSKRLDGEWADGRSPDDVAKELLEKTGIELVVR